MVEPSHNAMEQFRELYIKVDKDHTKEFAAAVEAALTDGWTRAVEAEKQGKEVGGFLDGEFFYYMRDDRREREPVMVAIYRKDAETLYVSNVVPLKGWQLSHQQYNGALQDFHDNILSKLKAEFPITFMLGSDQLQIGRMMSPEAFALLRQFSAAANKSTGSSHPSDQQRWFAFLATLSRTKHHFDVSSLFRWLTEVEKWPEKVAHSLASQFEFATELLRYVARK